MEVVTNDVNFQRVLKNMNEISEKKTKKKKGGKRHLKERLEETLLRFVLSLKKINQESEK